jgi:ADP-ribosylglycohydrolase
MRTPDVNKFAGCLIGQCLGDALGFIGFKRLTQAG